MACRRCLKTLTLTLTRHYTSFQPLKTLASQLPALHRIPQIPHFESNPQSYPNRTFSSRSEPPKISDDVDDHDDDDDEEEDETSDEEFDGEMDDDDDDDDDEGVMRGNVDVSRAYSVEDQIQEAAYIGYKVVGPIAPDDKVFKRYKPVFAIVQIGSHQFKVSNGDLIYVEKLKYCDVNDKIILNKVLMLGSPTQTITGRPILPEAAVHAVVEEHALDAKVIIFKKKRRKNYRRCNGHRQELTRLRIANIEGIKKPETTPPSAEAVETTSEKPEKEPEPIAA